MPDHERVRNHRHLRMFGRRLHDPNLWHLNRRSVSGAFGAGLFIAFVPVPFQMILAAGASILLRINLPLSVALVWITNPITMPAIFYFAYLVGNWTLGMPPQASEFQISMQWLEQSLDGVWLPLLLGSFICGTVCGTAAYIIMRLFWRWSIIKQWKDRRTNGSKDIPLQ